MPLSSLALRAAAAAAGGVTRKIHEDRDEEERKKDERGKNKASGETDARLCARLSSQC